MMSLTRGWTREPIFNSRLEDILITLDSAASFWKEGLMNLVVEEWMMREGGNSGG